jgi:hypothetical protein
MQWIENEMSRLFIFFFLFFSFFFFEIRKERRTVHSSSSFFIFNLVFNYYKYNKYVKMRSSLILFFMIMSSWSKTTLTDTKSSRLA